VTTILEETTGDVSNDLSKNLQSVLLRKIQAKEAYSSPTVLNYAEPEPNRQRTIIDSLDPKYNGTADGK